MAQHVETTTNLNAQPFGMLLEHQQTNRQTNRQTDKRTDGRTDATKRIISPASRSIISCPNHGLLKQQCYMRMEHCQLHPSPFPHGVTHLQTMFFLWKVGRLWVDKFFGRPFLCPSENIALI